MGNRKRLLNNLFNPKNIAGRKTKGLLNRRLSFEGLEGRSLLSLNINFIPVGNFFISHPQASEVLVSAAAQITGRVHNTLAAIPSGYDWKAYYTNPDTGERNSIEEVSIATNELIIFVGGRDLGETLARSYPQYSGGPNNGIIRDPDHLVRYRGQEPRFSTWGGSLSFTTSSEISWHFGTPGDHRAIPPGKYDFYSVALHEMIHLMGFCTNNQDQLTKSYYAGSYWTGPEATRANHGNNPKLDPYKSSGLHWDQWLRSNGRQPVMTALTAPASDSKRVVTTVDFAALRDIGWDVSVSVSSDLSSQARFSNGYQTDRVIWRPSDGAWYIAASADAGVVVKQWGLPGDVPVNGDFDGDGVTDFAVWRPSNGNWYVVPSANPTAIVVQQWGWPEDVPQPADFDGDGVTDFAIWRPSDGSWHVLPSSNPTASIAQQWGLPGDIPQSADYDGDALMDFAVWRPGEGNWYVIPSSNPAAPVTRQWGLPGDIPANGDFDGDGVTDYAVWRPSNGSWYVVPSADPGAIRVQQWGLPGDIPQPADFDGDGLVDYAVWRPSNGNWYVIQSSDTQQSIYQWGLPGDIPVGIADATISASRASTSSYYSSAASQVTTIPNSLDTQDSSQEILPLTTASQTEYALIAAVFNDSRTHQSLKSSSIPSLSTFRTDRTSERVNKPSSQEPYISHVLKNDFTDRWSELFDDMASLIG